MLRLIIILVHRIKLLSIIFLNYNETREKIKQDLKKLRRVFITLNALFNS